MNKILLPYSLEPYIGSAMDSHVSPSIPNNNNNKEKKRGSGGRKSKAMKLSTDPQSVAARQRRHRISDRFKVLQSLVPGGTKMDTVSMLEEAIHYVKFLKTQIWIHQALMNSVDVDPSSMLVKSSSSLSTQHSLYYSTSTLTTVAPPQPTPPPSLPISCFQGDASMLSHVASFNY